MESNRGRGGGRKAQTVAGMDRPRLRSGTAGQGYEGGAPRGGAKPSSVPLSTTELPKASGEDASGHRIYRQKGAAPLPVPILSASLPWRNPLYNVQAPPPLLCLPEEDPRHSDLQGKEQAVRGMAGTPLEDEAGRPPDHVSLYVSVSFRGRRQDSKMAPWGPVLNLFWIISLVLHSPDTRGQWSLELGGLQGPWGRGQSSLNLVCLRPALLFNLTSECGNQEEESHGLARGP